MKTSSNPSNIKPKVILMAILAAYAMPQIAFAEDNSNAVDLGKIEVIGTTPLAGVGLPIEQIPSNVQVVKGKELQQQNSLSIADYMNNNLQGVSVNETQNNPYQPDILFRGFTASPLLGTPQGLSVFQDGVRVNEPWAAISRGRRRHTSRNSWPAAAAWLCPASVPSPPGRRRYRCPPHRPRLRPGGSC